MPRSPARDQPTPEQTAELVDALRDAVRTAQAREVTPSRFTSHGGLLWSSDRARYVQIDIADPTTSLVLVDAATLLELDDWREPTEELLARLTAAGAVDYDAVVTAG